MGLADTFKALSDPLRRQILVLLRDQEYSAGELSSLLDILPSALSYHLSQLKKADLIKEYKVKNYVYYALNTTILDELILWVEQFQGGNQHEPS